MDWILFVFLSKYQDDFASEAGMGFRFRKRIKVFPGVYLNLSKSGVSTSLGRPGATVNIGKSGTRATLGVPGTGLSYSQRVGSSKKKADAVSRKTSKYQGPFSQDPMHSTQQDGSIDGYSEDAGRDVAFERNEGHGQTDEGAFRDLRSGKPDKGNANEVKSGSFGLSVFKVLVVLFLMFLAFVLGLNVA